MKRIYFLGIATIVLALVSCKKDASSFQGQIRYVDSTGVYFSADSAIITLHTNDTAQPAVMTQAADENGRYLLENVPDGKYVVMGVLSIDSNTTYVGVSPKHACEGKDFISAPVDLW